MKTNGTTTTGRTLGELVEDFYRNSPDWPYARPETFVADLANWFSDDLGMGYSRDEVAAAMVAFWGKHAADNTDPSDMRDWVVFGAGCMPAATP